MWKGRKKLLDFRSPMLVIVMRIDRVRNRWPGHHMARSHVDGEGRVVRLPERFIGGSGLLRSLLPLQWGRA